MSQTPPLSEEPLTNSAPPELNNNRKRAFTFCGSSFGVVRLEDINEIANLKADLVDFYKPINSQEMFALERMAIAQQLILRAARLDAGLFTSAMNDVINIDNNPVVTMDPDMIGADIDITRHQNRNFCLAEGFRRIARESDLMNLALRYRIQAERDYRRALEEFERLERRRPKLPNEPDVLTDPDGKPEILAPHELSPWIEKPTTKTPVSATPLAEVSLHSPARQESAQPDLPEITGFTRTLAAGAAPQFGDLLDPASHAPTAHRRFAPGNDIPAPAAQSESSETRQDPPSAPSRAPRNWRSPVKHRRATGLCRGAPSPGVLPPMSPLRSDACRPSTTLEIRIEAAAGLS